MDFYTLIETGSGGRMSDNLKQLEAKQAAKDAVFRALYMMALMMGAAGLCVFLNLGDFGTYIGFADEMVRQVFGGALICMAAVEIFVVVPLLKRNAQKENHKKN